MFEIIYNGGTSVSIVAKKTTIVSDPKRSMHGLKDINTTGSVVLASENRFLGDTNSALLVIDGPGEYEVGEFTIRGVAARRNIDTDTDGLASTMYRIENNDVAIAYIGNIDSKLNDDQLEEIGMVDIVIVPIGGNGYTLDATDAVALVRQIDPKVVIPVQYDEPGVAYEVPQESAERFVRELAASVEEVTSYKLKTSGSLPPSLTVYRLKRA